MQEKQKDDQEQIPLRYVYKCNTDASRIATVESATISFFCRDCTWNITQTSNKPVGDCPILVGETSAIKEAIGEAIRMDLENIIVESDSQAAISSITGKVNVQKQIFNLVINIIKLARKIKCIKFNYSKTSANILVDRLAKQAHGNLFNMLQFSLFNFSLCFIQKKKKDQIQLTLIPCVFFRFSFSVIILAIIYSLLSSHIINNIQW